MLDFNHVTFQYEEEDFNIIDDLSFTVERGDFVSIIGVSGCGKSTIFRLINKLLPLKSGEILVDDKSIDTLSGFAGYMPQKDLLFPWRTIEKNLCLPMEMMRIPKLEQRKRAEQILKDVGLLDYKDKYP
ncbi:MAG: ATP-binding cassette domain-containing protein, partial [Lachnospiraceae bacterium]|nr:ATP-binding cassette domain-containing protein [Lachnospiraceae bacterium]